MTSDWIERFRHIEMEDPHVAEFVGNCPRCGARRMTFDLRSETGVLDTEYGWLRWWEVFGICRNCRKGTVFVLGDQGIEEGKEISKAGSLTRVTGAVNRLVRYKGYVSLKDEAGVPPPEHLPPNLAAAFAEGATCLAVRCFNAAGTMFRLCVDLATRPLFPPEGDPGGPSAKIRRDLGLRLRWMFENGLLPEALRELSACIREDGNDGAHQGTLGKEDAEDLLDFTSSLLERLYTEPERLRLARARREQRRQ